MGFCTVSPDGEGTLNPEFCTEHKTETVDGVQTATSRSTPGCLPAALCMNVKAVRKALLEGARACRQLHHPWRVAAVKRRGHWRRQNANSVNKPSQQCNCHFTKVTAPLKNDGGGAAVARMLCGGWTIAVIAARAASRTLTFVGATSYNAVKGQAGTEIRQSQNTNVSIIQLNPRRIEDLALRRAIPRGCGP